MCLSCCICGTDGRRNEQVCLFLLPSVSSHAVSHRSPNISIQFLYLGRNVAPFLTELRGRCSSAGVSITRTALDNNSLKQAWAECDKRQEEYLRGIIKLAIGAF